MNLREEDFKQFEHQASRFLKNRPVSYKKLIEVCQKITGDEITKEYRRQLQDASSSEKNRVSQSENFRKLGNDCLNQQRYQKAIEMYTKSLTLAPKGSSARGQAYANRSAVLENMGEYEECIRDVDGALKNDYPQMLRFKLLLRQAKCHKQLRHKEQALSCLDKAKKCIDELTLANEKKLQLMTGVDKEYEAGLMPPVRRMVEKYPEPPALSYGSNNEAPGLSSAVQIAYNEIFGRHLVASRDIQAGDVVLVEQPYAAVLAPEHIYSHCSHCMHRSDCLEPCDTCDWALFCSETCKSSAMEKYHKEECPVAQKCFKVIDAMNLQRSCHFIRIVTTFGLQNAKSFLDANMEENPDSRTKGFSDLVYRSDSFQSIFDLVTNISQLPLLMVYAACTVSVKLAKCFDLKDQKFEHQLAAFCLKNLVALKNNAHEVTHTHVGGSSRVRYEVVGGGIFACSSLCNHSCSPNIFRTNYGMANIIKAVRFIKQGEQIFDSYKEHFAFDPKVDRQRYLSEHYHFKCQCVACAEDWGLVHTLPIHPQIKDKKVKNLYDQMMAATFACEDDNNSMPVTDNNIKIFLKVINILSCKGTRALLTQTMLGAQEDLKMYFKSKGNCII